MGHLKHFGIFSSAKESLKMFLVPNERVMKSSLFASAHVIDKSMYTSSSQFELTTLDTSIKPFHLHFFAGWLNNLPETWGDIHWSCTESARNKVVLFYFILLLYLIFCLSSCKNVWCFPDYCFQAMDECPYSNAWKPRYLFG